ncbi:hypothetical protein AAMO2058_000124100 [Amorphochlora amoebiformis]
MAGRRAILLFWLLPICLGGRADYERRKVCEIEDSIDDLVEDIRPVLQELINRPFFKYYRLPLCAQCVHPGFPAPMCGSPDCNICECSRDDLPCDNSGKCFLAPEIDTASPQDCQSSSTLESRLDLTIDAKELTRWPTEENGAWIEEDNKIEPSYVDLSINPERWTGYSPSQGSNLIWKAIYRENCPKGDCPVQNFLNRIISGLHTSITTHIVAHTCLERQKHGVCLKWGPDLKAFERRVLDPPGYISNLRVLIYIFLKAAEKAQVLFEGVDYHVSGEVKTQRQIKTLFRRIGQAGRNCGGLPIELPKDREHTRRVFRNISSILHCVGCDKCKLWGTVQFQGVATALRILFHDHSQIETLYLKKTEVIAFVQTLYKLSFSLGEIESLEKQLRTQTPKYTFLLRQIRRNIGDWKQTIDWDKIQECVVQLFDRIIHKARAFWSNGEGEGESVYTCGYYDQVRAVG